MDETFFPRIGSCRNAAPKTSRGKRGTQRPEFRFRFVDDWTFNRESSPPLSIARDFQKIGFKGDFVALAKQARRPLLPREADFGWLALAIYLADRTAPRNPYGNNGPAFWRRRIHIAIAVSDPALWQSVTDSLIHALEFLTEDDWTFEFNGQRAAFAAESQEHFREMRGPRIGWTSLYSGGLDSVAGALRWLRSVAGIGLLVSGQTHPRISASQQAQVAEMRDHFPQRIEHVGIDYGVPDKHGLSGFESSQRTRAFIHTALGSLAALMTENKKLFLFENGFGALNLPCDSAQIGSQNSRGTHPIFLQRMAAFVRAVFDCPFVIANPFTFSTKAQMLAASGMDEFASLFRKSFSCDRFPNYHHNTPQCGCCASCLVRRLAFHGSGIADDVAAYTQDVLRPHRQLHESELLALTKLSIQARTLAEALRAPSPWSALCVRWPDLIRMQMEFGSATFQESTIDLLRRHVAEWQEFSTSCREPAVALAA
jgi:hypothetical protein